MGIARRRARRQIRRQRAREVDRRIEEQERIQEEARKKNPGIVFTQTPEGTKAVNVALLKSENVQATQQNIDTKQAISDRATSNKELLRKINTPGLNKTQASALIQREAYYRGETISPGFNVTVYPGTTRQKTPVRDPFPIQGVAPRELLTPADRKVGRVAEFIFESEQRLNVAKSQLYKNLGLEKKILPRTGPARTVTDTGDLKVTLSRRTTVFDKLFNEYRDLPKAIARTPIEIGSGAVVLGGRAFLSGYSQISEKGRQERREANKRIIPTIAKTFDPTTSEGLVSIGLTALAIQTKATNIRVKRATSQPKTDYKIKFFTEKTTTKTRGFKSQSTVTYDKPVGFQAKGTGKNYVQYTKQAPGSDVVRSTSLKTVYGRQFKVDTMIQGTKGTGVVSMKNIAGGGFTEIKSFKFTQPQATIKSFLQIAKGDPFFSTSRPSYGQEISAGSVTRSTTYKTNQGVLKIDSLQKQYFDLRATAGEKKIFTGSVSGIELKGSQDVRSFNLDLKQTGSSSPKIKFSDSASPKLDTIRINKGAVVSTKQPTVYVSQNILSTTTASGTFTPTPTLFQKTLKISSGISLPRIVGKKGVSSLTQQVTTTKVLRPTIPTQTAGDLGGLFSSSPKSTPTILPVPGFTSSSSGRSRGSRSRRDPVLSGLSPKTSTFRTNVYKPTPISVSRPDQSRFLGPSSDLGSLVGGKPKSRSIPVVAPIFTQTPAQGQKRLIQPIPKQKQTPITVPVTYIPRRPQRQDPIIDPPPLPPPPRIITPVVPFSGGFLGGFGKPRKGGSATSRSIYKPDVTSILFNLSTTKTPSFVTPFTNRPVVRKKKKKKSRRRT